MTNEPFRIEYPGGRWPYLEDVSITAFRRDDELARYTDMYAFVHSDIDIKQNRDRSIVSGSRHIGPLAMRLRKAMGEKQILPHNSYIGGEFRVPSYQSYASGLEDLIWKVVPLDEKKNGYPFYWIVPKSEYYEGRNSEYARERRMHQSGFIVNTLCAYDYAYGCWDAKYQPMRDWVPDLYEEATFAAWCYTLPQPVSLSYEKDGAGYRATISWGAGEPRVYHSERMGRYLLSEDMRTLSARGYSWRNARAEALVQAWERMAANEPADRYASVMLSERAAFDDA